MSGEGADARRLDVQITTPVYPTEDRGRVEAAILNLFPTAEIEVTHGEAVGRAHSLERFAERLREQAIVATAREVFLDGRRGETFSFTLKKQAAHQGVVNFSVGNPDELGDLHVRVRVEHPDVERVIDLIAPPDFGEGTAAGGA